VTPNDSDPSHGLIFRLPGSFPMESGAILPSLRIAYTTHGRLNSDGSNAILVCHALTGDANAADATLPDGRTMTGWFDGVVGPGRGIDTDRYFVICSNILGSCYGTTGPTSVDPDRGIPYRMRFPQMTIRDMVRAQKLLLDHCGIRRLVTIIGASLGGMQALEWAALYPAMVESIIPIATSSRHTAWTMGITEAQRLAITSDPAWAGGDYTEQPARGLAIARAIAMIWYRSFSSFEERFGDAPAAGSAPGKEIRLFTDQPLRFSVQSYLRYQGQKLVDRFDANTYLYLTRAMDTHDLGRDRGTAEEVLAQMEMRALCIGISSDILYPPGEQKKIAALIPHGRYWELESPHGHDAFLIEFDRMNAALRDFLG
jgi:homoserine O-acetyltransferase/O-succinyltransferase